ncbi:MAG: AAA family ATPase [Chloroflexota bacterium]
MIVWINGPFGVGKSSVAQALTEHLRSAILIDPEEFGYLLWKWVPGGRASGDFQHLATWRRVVTEAVRSLSLEFAGPLVVPMTLLEPRYFDEIIGGLTRQGIGVNHFCLTAPREVVIERARERSGQADQPWAESMYDRYVGSLSDSRFDMLIDTSNRPIAAVAEQILGTLSY